MRSITLRQLLVFLVIISLNSGIAGALSVRSEIAAETVLMQPRKAKRAQKKQDAKEKKKKQAIKDGSKEAQKRAYDIQSPDVQARMKQNKKDTAARDKEKRKSNRTSTKKGAKKYK
jgi:hypothetical protein